MNCIIHAKELPTPKSTSLMPPFERMICMWPSKPKHQGAKMKRSLSCCSQGEKNQLILLRSVNRNAFTPAFLGRKEVSSVNVKMFPESSILTIFNLRNLIIYINAMFLKVNKSPVSLTRLAKITLKFHTSPSILMSLTFSRTCLIYKHYIF